jgi:hypothetical protein
MPNKLPLLSNLFILADLYKTWSRLRIANYRHSTAQFTWMWTLSLVWGIFSILSTQCSGNWTRFRQQMCRKKLSYSLLFIWTIQYLSQSHAQFHLWYFSSNFYSVPSTVSACSNSYRSLQQQAHNMQYSRNINFKMQFLTFNWDITFYISRLVFKHNETQES